MGREEGRVEQERQGTGGKGGEGEGLRREEEETMWGGGSYGGVQGSWPGGDGK